MSGFTMALVAVCVGLSVLAAALGLRDAAPLAAWQAAAVMLAMTAGAFGASTYRLGAHAAPRRRRR